MSSDLKMPDELDWTKLENRVIELQNSKPIHITLYIGFEFLGFYRINTYIWDDSIINERQQFTLGHLPNYLRGFVERFKKYNCYLDLSFHRDFVVGDMTRRDFVGKLFRLFPRDQTWNENTIEFKTFPTFKRIIPIESREVRKFIKENQDIKKDIIFRVRFSNIVDFDRLGLNNCIENDKAIILHLCKEELNFTEHEKNTYENCSYLIRLFKIVVHLESDTAWGKFLTQGMYDPRLLFHLACWAEPYRYEIWPDKIKKCRLEDQEAIL